VQELILGLAQAAQVRPMVEQDEVGAIWQLSQHHQAIGGRSHLGDRARKQGAQLQGAVAKDGYR